MYVANRTAVFLRLIRGALQDFFAFETGRRVRIFLFFGCLPGIKGRGRPKSLSPVDFRKAKGKTARKQKVKVIQEKHTKMYSTEAFARASAEDKEFKKIT